MFEFKRDYLSIKTFDESKRFIKLKDNETNVKVQVGDYIEKCGYRFEWNKDHLYPNELNKMRMLSDPLADNVMKKIDLKEDLMHSLYDLEKKNDSDAIQLLEQLRHIPKWVDWDKIEKGQCTYIKYLVGSGQVLFNLSLVGGYQAPLINKVLMSTGYLSHDLDSTRKRLLETWQMIHDCINPTVGRNALLEGGNGWESVIRVRFMHTHVRQRLLSSSNFDVNKYGIPINQEDMQVTLLSFSYNIIFGLDVLGYHLNKDEADSIIHLWRYIGYLIGIKDDINPCINVKFAKTRLESIIVHLLQPDLNSALMAHHNLHAVAWLQPTPVSHGYLSEISRSLMTPAMADILHLPPTNWWYRLCIKLTHIWARLLICMLPTRTIENLNFSVSKRVIDKLLGERTLFRNRKPLTKDLKSGRHIRLRSLNDIEFHQTNDRQRTLWWYRKRLIIFLCLIVFVYYRKRLHLSFIISFFRKYLRK